jgi:hypothetical protein
VNV